MRSVMELKYFTPEEFQRCIPPCHDYDMSERFMSRLDRMRAIYGKPMVLNSAYRSPEWELSHGRAGTSTHCEGHAVDVRCAPEDRLQMLTAAFMAGFRRIGIAETYLHLDDSVDRVQTTWLY